MRDIADIDDLSFLLNQYDHMKLERISMIDCIFVQNNSIDVVFEVENSTNFSSAIIRASNIQNSIPKLMVIPDSREAELLSFSDPLFKEAFKAGNWKYITYIVITATNIVQFLHHVYLQ